jgi:hypothetical protein
LLREALGKWEPAPLSFLFVRDGANMAPVFEEFQVGGRPGSKVYFLMGFVDRKPVSRRQYSEFLRASGSPVSLGMPEDDVPVLVLSSEARDYARWALKEVAASRALEIFHERHPESRGLAAPTWCTTWPDTVEIWRPTEIGRPTPRQARHLPWPMLERDRRPDHGPRTRAAFRCWLPENAAGPGIGTWPPRE